VPRIVAIPNGQFAQNCYLLAPDDSPEGVIIDPGEEADRILARARHEAIEVCAIWLTHAHLDHVLGVGAVRDATQADIYLHPADRPLYDGTPEQGRWFGFEVAAPPPPQHELAHGDRLPLGDIEIEVRHAPGHSPGSVCFVGPDFVIGGDVLFQGSIGRTDLPGGDFDRLIRSIREQVLTLPDDTVVYSGHGPVTTVGEERASNPFLRGG
jgi:glyoxylase-like metal-dependent hydrolase (beta-lactamase superfamily II)